MLAAVLISPGVSAQTLLSFEDRLNKFQDTTGLYDFYNELKDAGLSSEDTRTLAQRLGMKANQLSYPKILGLAYKLEGIQDQNTGQLEKAIAMQTKSYEILMANGHVHEANWVNFDLAVTHYMRSEFDLAVEVATRNIEAIKDIEPAYYNTLLRTAGEILRGANRLNRAADYLQLATEHSREIEREDALSYNLNRLGVVYYQGSKHELAKEAFEESLSIAREIDLERAITMNLNDMGELYFTLKDYERCIELYELALEREMIDGDRANTYNNIARLYGELNNNEEAIKYAKMALDLGNKTNSLSYVVDATRLLAENYESRSDFKRATNFYKQHMSSKDSLFKLETQRQLADAEAKYETAKKEQEIASLSEKEALERSRKQTYLAGMVGTGGLLLLVLFLVWRLTKVKRKIEDQNQELTVLNKTKDKFFSIIAHDLRSPMIALQGVGQRLDFFIRKGKQDKLLEMGNKIDESIDRLNHLLNNLLNWASMESGGMPNNPMLLQNNQLITDTVELYRGIAQAKDVTIESKLTGDPIFADRNMAATVIRNILSNAVKFTPVGGTILVESCGGDRFTTVKIKDNGMGMNEETKQRLFDTGHSKIGESGEEGFGLGLKLCMEFVSSMKGRLIVESKPGEGSTFLIELPNKEEIFQGLKVA